MKTGPSYPVRLGFLILSVLAIIGMVYQVLLVGLSLLGGQPSWETHVGFGHMLGLLPLLLVGVSFIGRFPRSEKRLTLLFLGIYILQAEVFAVIRDAVPFYAAWHPVLAMAMFASGTWIAWRAYVLVRRPASIKSVTEELSDGQDRMAA